MEGADEEWNTSGGKVSRVLNRGLRLGKQILVAGFMASSAAVVLPPLVVASAIGLSVSVPYGLFLASHAYAEKLMSKLLPMPTPPPLLLNSEEKEDRYIDMEKEEDVETKRGIEMIIEDINDEEHNEPEELSQDAIDGSDYIREEEKASPEKLIDLKLTNKRENEEEPMMGGHGIVMTIECLDEIGNEIEEYEVTNVVLEEFGDEAIEGEMEEAELEQETKGLLEKIRDEGKNETMLEGKDAEKVMEEMLIENADEKSRKPEESCSAMVDEHTDPMELPVCNEVILNEEEKMIWEQIDAIRMIVGYEGTPQASCMDELKNLYIFTGVEPPTFPLEINDNVRFLMSIVGVKSNVP